MTEMRPSVTQLPPIKKKKRNLLLEQNTLGQSSISISSAVTMVSIQRLDCITIIFFVMTNKRNI